MGGPKPPLACGTARDRNDAAETRATLPTPSLAPRAVLMEALSPLWNPPPSPGWDGRTMTDFSPRVFFVFLASLVFVLASRLFSNPQHSGYRGQGFSSSGRACQLSCPKAHGNLVTDRGSHVPCIGRWMLNHWTVRKVPSVTILNTCFCTTLPTQALLGV